MFLVLISKRIMNWQDYAWVKQGMIFPFSEFMNRCVWLDGSSRSCFCWNIGDLISIFLKSLSRFQGQTQLFKCKPSDFRMALEEAKLAKDGILESHLQAEEVTNVEAQPDRVEEVMISNIDQEYYCQDQVKLIFYICVFIS